MKRFIFGSALALILLIVSVAIVPAQNSVWTKINPPAFGNFLSLTVTPIGDIFVTTAGNCHLSHDQGMTWEHYPIPLNSQYIDHSLWFKDRLYVGTEDGIISSPDGSSWQMEKAGYGFPSICADDSYLYVFGIGNNSWRTDGNSWVHINQPGSVITTACASNSVITAIVGDIVYKSYNNGQGWSNSGAIEIQAIEIAANGSQYEAVGFNMSHTMQACGEYPYLYDGGDIRCSAYWNGISLTGGSQTLNPGFYQGIILENGDLNSAVFFNGDVEHLSGNGNFVIADILGCDLYIRSAKNILAMDDGSPGKVFRAYPNPVESKLNIVVTEAARFSLYDLAGRELIAYSLPAGVNMIDLSSFPTGTYFLANNRSRQVVIKK